MRREPVPSATGEQPCARSPPLQPPCRARSARPPWHSVSAGDSSLGMTPPTRRSPGCLTDRIRLRTPGAPAVRAVVRAGAGLADDRQRSRRAAHGGALRRTGAAGRRRSRAAAARTADRSGRGGGPLDAAAGGRGQRRRAAGAARLAGMGRCPAGSDRDRRRRPDHCAVPLPSGRPDPGARRTMFAGGRRMAAASRAGGRGGADAAGHRLRGRWGRPRSRTARGRGGHGVPPCPVAAHRLLPTAASREGDVLSRWPSRMPHEWSPEHGRGR